MKKKNLIYALIALAWGFIILNWFIDSELYETIVLWMFTIPALLGVAYLLIFAYVGIKRILGKKR